MKLRDLAGEYAEYFEYLTNMVGGEQWWDGYDETFLRLFERQYYWHLDLDGNWQGHVETLRANALRYGKVPALTIPNRWPSVLEVLIALSIDVAMDIMWSQDTDPVERLPEYFNAMFVELGFDCGAEAIDSAIDAFLSGERVLADPQIGRPLTLWEQANLFFSTQFAIENEDGTDLEM